jgi:threonine aldolase
LASGLAEIKGLETDPSQAETNIVRFQVQTMPAQELVEKLKSRGVLVLPVARDTIRAVTNLMVTAEDVDSALDMISDSLK